MRGHIQGDYSAKCGVKSVFSFEEAMSELQMFHRVRVFFSLFVCLVVVFCLFY